MAIKEQKTTSFHNQWRLHCYCDTAGATETELSGGDHQMPNPRVPDLLMMQDLLLWGGDTGELRASTSSACSPLTTTVRPDLLIRHQASVKDGGEQGHPNAAVTDHKSEPRAGQHQMVLLVQRHNPKQETFTPSSWQAKPPTSAGCDGRESFERLSSQPLRWQFERVRRNTLV